MLTEFAKAVLKTHNINEEDVDEVADNLVVTFKDGTKHQIVECWSRVMGYYRPMSEYNVGKRQEHADRKLFEEPSCGCE